MAHVYAQGPGDESRSSVEELLNLMEGPAWMTQAACKNHPEVTWFPKRGGGRGAQAKRICAGCPVRYKCLRWALEWGPELQGIWGGRGAEARGKMLMVSRKTKMPVSTMVDLERHLVGSLAS
jgi:WhiB family transcriptional regulator, redox-sensing transcriptional regulator